jgi:betaine-aldehyde dehydrogenase
MQIWRRRNSTKEPATAWLAFWGQVLHVESTAARAVGLSAPHAHRICAASLKRLVPPDEAQSLAAMIAAMIDGVWLRAALSGWREADSERARALLTAVRRWALEPTVDARRAGRAGSAEQAGGRRAVRLAESRDRRGHRHCTVAGAADVDAAVRAARARAARLGGADRRRARAHPAPRGRSAAVAQ